MKANAAEEIADDDGGESYTPSGLAAVLETLGKIVADIKTSKELMELKPILDSVRVPYESSRENGMKRLRAWADSLRDATHEAKRVIANGIANGASVPDTARKKPKEKSP